VALNSELLEKTIHQFTLNIDGIHGAEHWIRVYENGFKLSQMTGANANIVMYFAILHDSQRVSNSEDSQHGPRAAIYAKRHRREIDLDNNEFELLIEAISSHTRGCRTDADISVQTCLDADRLDITRTGCMVNAACLYTEAAKDEAIRINKRRY
jgi:uncharacterized protein